MSTPEIITVNSEALEAQIRDLLPSQSGFGSELQASNVIMPIIDLTATAEGSGLDVSLQQAMAHGSQTSFKVANTQTTIVTSTGFFRVFGTMTGQTNTGSGLDGNISITDGSTNKILFDLTLFATNGPTDMVVPFDFITFCAAGESVFADSNSSKVNISVTTRQLATVTGTLVNPSGFVAE